MGKFDYNINTPNHTRPVFDPRQFKQVVKWCRAWLKANPQIKAIAGCGNSGVPVVGAVSYLTGKPMITVRKKEETAHLFHGGQDVTGYSGLGEYAIIDDCIDSGRTVQHMVQKIKAKQPQLRVGAVLIYRQAGSEEVKDLDGNQLPVLVLPRWWQIQP